MRKTIKILYQKQKRKILSNKKKKMEGQTDNCHDEGPSSEMVFNGFKLDIHSIRAPTEHKNRIDSF